MRNLLPLFAFSLSALLLTGCTYTGVQTPLQPGEKIIFHTRERADGFRSVSGNDLGHTNRIVEITTPTTLTTE